MSIKYNLTRLNLYEQLFEAVIKGEHQEAGAANLLIDIRWPEVPRAFVNCVTSNSCTNTLRPLAADLGRLASRAAEQAFGTRRHSELPSWFLQNHECFLASCLHKLLRAFARQPALAPHQMRRAFEALFDAAEALKPFLGLSYLARSTSAHALMSATANARYDFLRDKGCVASAPALCFAEMLAERILQQPGRDVDLESPCCFFARSARWQQFATTCADFFSPDEAFARLQQRVAEHYKKGQSPRLFCLASAFLEADEKENAPVLRERAKPRRARACRPAIFKRSRPFVTLLRRLLASPQHNPVLVRTR